MPVPYPMRGLSAQHHIPCLVVMVARGLSTMPLGQLRGHAGAVMWRQTVTRRERGRDVRTGAHGLAHTGGVSNVDIDGNHTLQIKALGVTISTFETLPNGGCAGRCAPGQSAR